MDNLDVQEAERPSVIHFPVRMTPSLSLPVIDLSMRDTRFQGAKFEYIELFRSISKRMNGPDISK